MDMEGWSCVYDGNNSDWYCGDNIVMLNDGDNWSPYDGENIYNRHDLKIQHDDFESTWVEMVNKLSQPINQSINLFRQ